MPDSKTRLKARNALPIAPEHHSRSKREKHKTFKTQMICEAEDNKNSNLISSPIYRGDMAAAHHGDAGIERERIWVQVAGVVGWGKMQTCTRNLFLTV
jgi:hypothetical protein